MCGAQASNFGHFVPMPAPVAESVSRWASLSTLGAEPTGLNFDIGNPNLAFINVQLPSSGVNRLIEIASVPEPASVALRLLGLATGGGVVDVVFEDVVAGVVAGVVVGGQRQRRPEPFLTSP